MGDRTGRLTWQEPSSQWSGRALNRVGIGASGRVSAGGTGTARTEGGRTPHGGPTDGAVRADGAGCRFRHSRSALRRRGGRAAWPLCRVMARPLRIPVEPGEGTALAEAGRTGHHERDTGAVTGQTEGGHGCAFSKPGTPRAGFRHQGQRRSAPCPPQARLRAPLSLPGGALPPSRPERPGLPRRRGGIAPSCRRTPARGTCAPRAGAATMQGPTAPTPGQSIRSAWRRTAPTSSGSTSRSSRSASTHSPSAAATAVRTATGSSE